MANKIRNTAKNFHAPVLPNPPAEYNQALTHQRDNALRIYFQNIDEALSQALQYDTSDIIDGSIPNSKLENSTVSFGGVTLSLGESDATPAFDLSDATGYPTSSLVGTITTAQIADDAVTEAKLANSINSAIAANTAKVTNATHTGEVTGATALTIADGAVVTARIADNAVSSAKIADSNVLTGNIADLNVTTNKIATDAVTNAKIADDAVDTAQIADDAVGTAQIADDAITTDQIADSAVSFGQLNTSSVSASAIQSNAVTTTKIADDAVTAAKIDETADITVAGLTVTPSGSASGIIKATAANNYSAELHLGDVGDPDAGRIQYVNATDSMGFLVANSEKMRIDSAGDVGIGTTNPTAKLHIQQPGGTAVTPPSGTDLFISDSNGSSYVGMVSNIYGTVGMYLGDTADPDRASVLYSNYYDRMTFNTAATEKMRIDSSGRVLMGTTSNGAYGAKLRVAGYIESYGFKITSTSSQIFGSGNYGAYGLEIRSFTAYNASYAQPIMKFAGSTGSEYGSIKILGAATQYNTSSDERLKENIRDADDAGDKIDAIKIRQFDWIDGEHQDYGVIAQELLPVAPEAVSKGYTEDDMMGVDYSKLVPTLIKEIQSLRKRVEELEKDK